jgi:uncharacterized protein (TIGR03435 family)
MGNHRTRLVILLAGFSIVAIPLLSQSLGQRLAFEVASIKPSDPNAQLQINVACHGVDTSSSPDGPTHAGLGRCILRNVSLKLLIVLAYEHRFEFVRSKLDQMIIAAPDWTSSDLFDIEAKAEVPSKATLAELFDMFQQLLADRFQLKFHYETKDQTGLALVVAKNGPKLKAPAGDDLPPRLYMAGQAGGKVIGHKSSVASLAQFLSGRLGHAVTDKTGLTDLYDFTLTWTPDDSEVGSSGVPIRSTSEDDPLRISLLTALQEQLGLRLETQKFGLQVVVIDHVEKPTAN